jgi:hypothetical protein
MRPSALLVAALAATLACASGPAPDIEAAGPKGDSKTLTTADLANATQLNLLAFITAERPQWLKTPDGRPSPVVVYLDEARLGGASTLSGVTLSAVTLVRYYEASAAQQKFNGRDLGPVIHVITK